jgi:hypothetical protein
MHTRRAPTPGVAAAPAGIGHRVARHAPASHEACCPTRCFVARFVATKPVACSDRASATVGWRQLPAFGGARGDEPSVRRQDHKASYCPTPSLPRVDDLERQPPAFRLAIAKRAQEPSSRGAPWLVLSGCSERPGGERRLRREGSRVETRLFLVAREWASGGTDASRSRQSVEGPAATGLGAGSTRVRWDGRVEPSLGCRLTGVGSVFSGRSG